MDMVKAVIKKKHQMLTDTYIYRIKLSEPNNFTFIPGQYVYLKNPNYRPEEMHPFSIASSPLEKTYVEFCIKVCGDWTQELSTLPEKSEVYVSSPQGNFTWDPFIQHAVFLLGGIGISPIMAMLRTFIQKNEKPSSVTIIYGNRTPETIAYKDELDDLAKKLSLKIVHIFSHIPDTHPWKGYRGFITQTIIEKEANLQHRPTFFVIGPPIFVTKMKAILTKLSIPNIDVKEEFLEKSLTL